MRRVVVYSRDSSKLRYFMRNVHKNLLNSSIVRNGTAVTNDKTQYVGFIYPDEIRGLMFDHFIVLDELIDKQTFDYLNARLEMSRSIRRYNDD